VVPKSPTICSFIGAKSLICQFWCVACFVGTQKFQQ